MSDISIVWDKASSHGDFAMNGADILTGDDLETAILISLFSDAMAAPDDVIPDGSNDPRGWWGDEFDTVTSGSKLWLLDRSKQTTQVLNNAQDYITQALQWLIDDGVVSKFDITVQWVRASFLGAQITAYRPNGAVSSGNYLWAWNGL